MDWERPEEHVIDDGEERHVGAHADRERRRAREGERLVHIKIEEWPLSAGDDLTQSLTRGLPFAIPLADLAPRELVSETRQLLNPFVQRGQVTLREIEDARTGRCPGATQFRISLISPK